jgi:hypothetical protein
MELSWVGQKCTDMKSVCACTCDDLPATHALNLYAFDQPKAYKIYKFRLCIKPSNQNDIARERAIPADCVQCVVCGVDMNRLRTSGKWV